MSVPSVIPRRKAPTAELTVITPAMAEEWLGRNDKNRSLRAGRVETYSQAMTSDDWVITGEGIKFDWNGRMIDGQHRLHAVVESGISVPMFVFRNLHPDAQLVIDTGAKRTAADALKLAGIVSAHTMVIASAAGIGVRWAEGFYANSGRASSGREVTNTEVIEWVRANEDVIDATSVAVNFAKALYLPPSPLTFAFLLLSRIDADEALTFLNDLRNMRTDGPGDPRFTLLRRLKAIDENREYIRPAQHLFYLFRTWNALRDGEQLHQLRTGTNGAGGEIKVPEPK